MDNETKQALDAMEARIGKRFDQTDGRIFHVESKLLTAFHGWANSTDVKLRTFALHEQRLSVIEERITRLEQQRDKNHNA
jgi:hypothetical protein